jgi:osmotically-inducible protein OsmY
LPITVSVDDGVVTLTGVVGNAYEKERAGEDAYLADNVRKVDNNLKVKWWKEKYTRGEILLPSDKELEQSVHDELFQDLRIDPLGVAVDASYGHVTLRGAVPTYHQKQLAEHDANEVVGVAWVSNLLSVNNERRADDRIQRDIESAFDSDYSLNGQDIRVDVHEGTAVLTGNVNEYYERYHASNVAGKVLGVNKVANNIVVNSYPKYTDTALKARIEDRLSSNWETSWVSEAINVAVEAGNVTLSGDVDTWSERDEAGRIAALTDGVYSVDNKLIVAQVDYPWGEAYDSWPVIP